MVSDQLGIPLHEGEVLGDRYRVESVIGTGGMGFVVAATHVELGQRVALKFLLPGVLEREEAVARFQREAQAACRIQSPHVARVFDVGRHPELGPYLVMEFLTGIDLAEELRERGRLPVTESVDLVLQVCEAIAEAHALGIIHRDLKPANLFLSRSAAGAWSVKVLDFGISKALGVEGSVQGVSMTATASVMGSPAYMSPEQVRSSKNVDGRTDLWSLGVILFEMLTGSTPYDADSAHAMCAAIAADPVRSPRTLVPDLPEGIARAVLRCLEKDVDHRVQNVAELAALLTPFASKEGVAAAERIRRVVAEGARTLPLGASVLPTFPRTLVAGQTLSQQGPNRSRWIVLGAVAVVLVTAALLGRGLLRTHAASGAVASPVSSLEAFFLQTPSAPSLALSSPSAPPAISNSPIGVGPEAGPKPVRPAKPTTGPSSTKGGSGVDPLAEP